MGPHFGTKFGTDSVSSEGAAGHIWSFFWLPRRPSRSGARGPPSGPTRSSRMRKIACKIEAKPTVISPSHPGPFSGPTRSSDAENRMQNRGQTNRDFSKSPWALSRPHTIVPDAENRMQNRVQTNRDFSKSPWALFRFHTIAFWDQIWDRFCFF